MAKPARVIRTTAATCGSTRSSPPTSGARSGEASSSGNFVARTRRSAAGRAARCGRTKICSRACACTARTASCGAFHPRAAPAERTLPVGPELPDGADYVALPKGQKVTVKDGKVTLTLGARSPAFVTRMIPIKAR